MKQDPHVDMKLSSGELKNYIAIRKAESFIEYDQVQFYRDNGGDCIFVHGGLHAGLDLKVNNLPLYAAIFVNGRYLMKGVDYEFYSPKGTLRFTFDLQDYDCIGILPE